MGWPSPSDTNIDDFFMHGHHFLMLSGGEYEEYPDVIAKYLGKPEDIEITDATINAYKTLPDGRIEVEYYIATEEWEKDVLVVGKIIVVDDEIMFKADTVVIKE
jgi:hypothetical protein